MTITPRHPFLILVFLLIFLTGMPLWATPSCAVNLSNSHELDGRIFVEGIKVTGEEQYPLESIIHNLGLELKVLESWKSSGAKIVSVGEGRSNLVPWLRQNGLNAFGLDVWYSPKFNFPKSSEGKKMEDYYNRNAQNLITGRAEKMPFENESVDVFLSHGLVNNLHIVQTFQMMMEEFRCLKVGGESRIGPLTLIQIKALDEFLEDNPSLRDESREMSFANGLLVYKKKKPVHLPEVPMIRWDHNKIYDTGEMSGAIAHPERFGDHGSSAVGP